MEKTLYNQVGEVKGKKDQETDSFSFQFTPQNDNLKRTRGSLFTLVTVNGSAESKYDKASKLYQLLQSSYYAKANGSVINSLSDTLDSVTSEYIEKTEAEEKLKFDLVAVVFWGSVLYIAKIGSAIVYVARGGKLKKLDFAKVASGVLEDQDSVVLASKEFEKLSSEELSKYLAPEKFEEVLSNIDKASAEIAGAVSLVIRLSVNAPQDSAAVSTEETIPSGEVPQFEPKKTEESPEEAVKVVETDEVAAEKIAEADSDLEPVTIETSEEKEADSSQTEKIDDSAYLPAKKEHPLNKVKANVSTLSQKILPMVQAKGQTLLKLLAKPWRRSQAGELVDHVAIRRARLLQIVVVVVGVLLISLVFGFFGNQSKKSQGQITTLIASAETGLKQALNFKTIDPSRAKALVDKAKKDIAQARSLGAKDSKLDSLEEQASSLVAEITGSFRVDNLTSLFDFTKLEAKAALQRLAITDGVILLTDTENNAVYKFDVAAKAGVKLDGDFQAPGQIASFQNGYYVQTSSGLLKIDKTSFKTTTVGTNNNWGDIVGSSVFQSQGNLYLLDKGKNEVWRYLATSTGLSSAKAYLTGQKPDLKEATGIAIDDLVWIVTKKGTIYKISRGQTQTFSITGLSEAFGEVVDIYNTTETKNIYLLDSGKGKVVLVSKDGAYQKQFSADKLHQATSLVVDETAQIAYVASSGKLYSLSLR